MDIFTAYVVLIGLIGGLVHQAMDRSADNCSGYNWMRAIIVGIAAALLVYWIGISNYIAIFVAAYFGDSIILNIVNRVAKNLDL